MRASWDKEKLEIVDRFFPFWARNYQFARELRERMCVSFYQHIISQTSHEGRDHIPSQRSWLLVCCSGGGDGKSTEKKPSHICDWWWAVSRQVDNLKILINSKYRSLDNDKKKYIYMWFLPTSLESLQVLRSYKSFKIRHNENVLSRASNAPCDQVYLAEKKTLLCV